MRLGFAGLGLMGAPMAERLLRRGTLGVYNRSAGPRDRLAALEATPFERPEELFAASDLVFLMLADDTAVEQVLGRNSSEFASRVAGKWIVNMGTHAPAWSAELGREIILAGGRFVEAPVSGSAGAAEAGALVAMIAGATAELAVVRPLLEPLCREVVVTGGLASALACKLAVNLFLIASVAALAEATELARRSTVDLGAFSTVIGKGPLGSEVARGKLAKMIARDFAPQASIRDVCKNAALVAAAAAVAGVPADLLAVAMARFDAVRETGHGALDMAAVVTAFEHEGAA